MRASATPAAEAARTAVGAIGGHPRLVALGVPTNDCSLHTAEQIGGKGAMSPVARKLLTRSDHMLCELGEEAPRPA